MGGLVWLRMDPTFCCVCLLPVFLPSPEGVLEIFLGMFACLEAGEAPRVAIRPGTNWLAPRCMGTARLPPTGGKGANGVHG